MKEHEEQCQTHLTAEEQGYKATESITSLSDLLQKLFEKVHDLERRVTLLEKSNR